MCSDIEWGIYAYVKKTTTGSDNSLLPVRHQAIILTHWGQDKMAAISQTAFSNAFSWMKMYEFRLKFHWSLFLRVELTIFQHWFRQWLGAVEATSYYLKQCWLVYRRTYASLGLSELTKQRVLMHGHQGWNVRHGLCHIYMIYVYIWVVFSFCLFCCLFIIVTTQFVALYKPCKPKPKFI